MHICCTLPVSGGDGNFAEERGRSALQNTEQSVLPTAPGRVLVPSTVQEVVSAVKAAAEAGGNVRCIGHGNSWMPIFFDAVRFPLIQASEMLYL